GVFPEMVYNQVMCNAHYPWKKFAFFVVGTPFKGFDYLYKGILKNVLGYISVKNLGVDKTIDSLFVAGNKITKCRFIAVHISAYQKRIRVCVLLHINTFLINKQRRFWLLGKMFIC